MLRVRSITVFATAAALVLACTASPAVIGGVWHVERVRVNGVPLALRSGELRGSPSTLAPALLAHWQAPGVGTPQVSVLGSRTVIGRQRGRLHETVTLRQAGPGRTDVLIAVADLGAPARQLPRPPIALPVGQSSLLIVEQGDGRDAVRTFSFVSDRSPTAALSQWRRSLVAAGWRPYTTPSMGVGPEAQVLWADRGRERIDAVFSAGAPGARIVVKVYRDAE